VISAQFAPLVNRCPFRRCEPSLLEDLEDMNYLTMNKERNATNASDGMEGVPSSFPEAMTESGRVYRQIVDCNALVV